MSEEKKESVTEPTTQEAPKTVPPAEPPKEDPKPEGDKAEAPKVEPKPEGVPEKYELKLPENSLLDATHLARIEAEAKARGLSNKDAQAMVEKDSQLVADYQKKQVENLKQVTESWVNELRNDPEFGGDKLNETAEVTKRFIARFADDAFKEQLDANEGFFGKNPGLARMIMRASKYLTEDKLVGSGSAAAAQKPTHTRVWGYMNEEKGK